LIQKQKKQLLRFFLLIFPALILIHLVTLFPLTKQSLFLVVVSYTLFITILIIFVNKENNKESVLLIKQQDILEKINIANESIQRWDGLLVGLEKKKIRYSSLGQVITIFNQNLALEDVGKSIVEETFNLFGRKVSILLYLFSRENNRLELSFSKKESPKEVIKEKYGDLFDDWVVKHNQSLLVEDVYNDFRFDPENIRKEVSRHLGSIMISPLITSNRFIGILRIESNSIESLNSEDLRFLSTIASLAVISLENSLLYERTEELSIRDGLTGLYLRRFLNERVKEELQFARKKNYELSILMVDVDNFKIYNDKFGHRCGDIVLTHIAELLKKMFDTPRYLISRFGGEEFVVLLPMTSKKDALVFAQKVRKDIENKVIVLRRKKTNVTVSIGVATFPEDADSWTELIHQSDSAMYKAKQMGRNKVCSI